MAVRWFKGSQVWEFRPYFFTLINHIWVGDLRLQKVFFWKHGRYWPFCVFTALQRSVLLLKVSATGPKLHLDVSALQRYVSNPQGPVHTYCRTCSLRFENDFFAIERVRFASKIIFFLSNVFASLRRWFSFYLMCLLRFENNFLSVGHVRLRFENSFLAIERVRFASKINFLSI